MENGLEGAADKMFDAPISPVQIAKKAERAMRREKMVGAGKQYAPTLYTVLVNPDDDARLFGYYPTLAGETETFLAAQAEQEGLTMDGQPLVRFIVDESLRRGKFDIVAELVSAPIVAQLRNEEMQRYGLAAPAPQQAAPKPAALRKATSRPSAQAAKPAVKTPQDDQDAYVAHGAFAPTPQPAQPEAESGGQDQEDAGWQDWRKQPLPYVPEEEIDRSIDYGEYTFNSQDFEDYEQHGPAVQPVSTPAPAPSQPWDEEEDDASAADADLSGLDVEAYNPYLHDSRDLVENQNAPAVQPSNTVTFAGEAKPNRSMVKARLVDKTSNRSYDLAAPRLVLGRSSQSDVIIDDVNASRSHAELRQESPGVWILTDLGSTNGTQVNGEAVASCELELGDHIVIGTSELVFLLD